MIGASYVVLLGTTKAILCLPLLQLDLFAPNKKNKPHLPSNHTCQLLTNCLHVIFLIGHMSSDRATNPFPPLFLSLSSLSATPSLLRFCYSISNKPDSDKP
ncbi:hypothetical protein IEQ34_019983 [Dendrobium chrysotoxum]|uniref:Uncharacterized protein n=1 Tax=Dendrobium chrysotoxum TaxID=161865 RepID=A0AAV7FSX7_DENCH|nr:hypothetical protein IEQ34_019983 [Dendrobium chrysotoxum]